MHNVLSKINILQGTNSVHDFSTGNTLPIVARPWGMHHWTLQTGRSPWSFNSSARRVWGVRLTHQPSPWMRDYAGLLLQPFHGECTDDIEHQGSAYRQEDATLQPNYLKTELLRYGISIEMSPTERGAVFAFTRNSTEPLRLRFEFDGKHHLHATPGSVRIQGETADHFQGEHLLNFGLHFVGEFNVAPSSFERTERGGWLSFPPGVDRVELRLAASFISQDMAACSLRAELVGKELRTIERDGERIWTALLSRIEMEPRWEGQDKTFYSCLYRCLLFPRFLHEIDEQGRTLHYSPYDGKVHPGIFCTDIGFWDVYRTLIPLLALVYPDVIEKMMEGWMNACRESGWTPNWASPGLRDCMIGTHFDVVVADLAVKGFNNWDLEEAFGYLWKNATVQSTEHSYGRRDLEDFIRQGYVAADRSHYAVSSTLDYAYDDFCIAQVARLLGKREEAENLLRRSTNYRNVFDRSVGFMRGKCSDGKWLAPFREFAWGGSYIEGGPWQHTFNVPHDIPGLADLFGGPGHLCRKLDAMLATPPRFEIGSYPYEIHEMTEMALGGFGQYAHSNQPVHNYLFLYALAGEPEKTSYWVRRVLQELYSPNHFPGDEDNGEMSAWYVWASLGLYPYCPGKPEYLKFSPSVASAVVRIPGRAEELEIGAEVKTGIITHAELLGSR